MCKGCGCSRSCRAPGRSGAADGPSINPAPGALWSSAGHQPRQEPEIVPLLFTPPKWGSISRKSVCLRGSSYQEMVRNGQFWFVTEWYLFAKFLCLFNSWLNLNISLWSLQRLFLFWFWVFSGCTDWGMLKMCVPCPSLWCGYKEMFQILLIFVYSQALFS